MSASHRVVKTGALVLTHIATTPPNLIGRTAILGYFDVR